MDHHGNATGNLSVELHFLPDSRTTVELPGFREMTDGYGAEHEALEKRTVHKLYVDGSVELDQWGTGEITRNSWMRITDRSYMVDKNTTIACNITTSTYLQYRKFGATISYDSRDSARLFPALRNITTGMKIENIYRDRALEKGDSGMMDMGGIGLPWVVDRQEEIAGEQALRIVVSLPPDGFDGNDTFAIDDIHIHTWVASRYPVPVRKDIMVAGTWNTGGAVQHVRLHYRSTLLKNEFVRGDEPVVYDSPRFPERSDVEEREDWFMERMPSHGSEWNSSIPADFTAEIAYERAYMESADFREFMDGRPGAYAALALYNESGEHGDGRESRWNLTFAEKDAGRGYHLDVYRDRIENEGIVELDDVQFGLAVQHAQRELEQRPITFAGFEQILENDSQVRDELFGNGRLDFDEVTLRLQTNPFDSNLSFPGFPVASAFGQLDSSRYVYVVNRGNEFTAAVDAETGQFLFIAKHEGDF